MFYDGLALYYLAALPPHPGTKEAFITASHVQTALPAFRLKILLRIKILLSPSFAFQRELEGIFTINPKLPGGIVVTSRMPRVHPRAAILIMR